MSDFTFAQTVWLHIIVALPATITSVAAFMKAIHVKRDTQQIIISINGERSQLHAEVAELRAQLDRHRREDTLT